MEHYKLRFMCRDKYSWMKRCGYGMKDTRCPDCTESPVRVTMLFLLIVFTCYVTTSMLQGAQREPCLTKGITLRYVSNILSGCRSNMECVMGYVELNKTRIYIDVSVHSIMYTHCTDLTFLYLQTQIYVDEAYGGCDYWTDGNGCWIAGHVYSGDPTYDIVYLPIVLAMYACTCSVIQAEICVCGTSESVRVTDTVYVSRQISIVDIVIYMNMICLWYFEEQMCSSNDQFYFIYVNSTRGFGCVAQFNTVLNHYSVLETYITFMIPTVSINTSNFLRVKIHEPDFVLHAAINLEHKHNIYKNECLYGDMYMYKILIYVFILFQKCWLYDPWKHTGLIAVHKVHPGPCSLCQAPSSWIGKATPRCDSGIQSAQHEQCTQRPKDENSRVGSIDKHGRQEYGIDIGDGALCGCFETNRESEHCCTKHADTLCLKAPHFDTAFSLVFHDIVLIYHRQSVNCTYYTNDCIVYQTHIYVYAICVIACEEMVLYVICDILVPEFMCDIVYYNNHDQYRKHKL